MQLGIIGYDDHTKYDHQIFSTRKSFEGQKTIGHCFYTIGYCFYCPFYCLILGGKKVLGEGKSRFGLGIPSLADST